MLNGFININKPQDMTSHDVVAIVRRILKRQAKVGHTGTLDPNATGVLPICIGKGTRLAEYVTDLPKTYIGELTLGITTSTQDIWGSELTRMPAGNIALADVENVLPQFLGNIEQIPPMVSAVKIDGKKLYELARQGIEVERKARKVEIKTINILNSNFNGEHPTITLEVECSSGTYIRTLFNDIGATLGVGGMLSSLVRTQVGEFNLDNALTLETVEKMAENKDFSFICDFAFGIEHLTRAISDDKRLLNGISVPIDMPEGKNYRIYNSNGDFLGIGEIRGYATGNQLKMNKVIVTD